MKDFTRIVQGILSVVLLGSIFMIISSMMSEIKQNRFEKLGVVVDGEVLDSGRLEQVQGLKTHFLDVQFLRSDGNLVQKTFSVGTENYNWAIKRGHIPVTYVPEFPELSRVDSYHGFNRSHLYFSIIISFLALILVITLEIIYRKKNKL